MKKSSTPAAAHKPKQLASTTAAAILGKPSTGKVGSNGHVKIRPEWAKYYQNLLELRERLLHQMSGLAKAQMGEITSGKKEVFAPIRK